MKKPLIEILAIACLLVSTQASATIIGGSASGGWQYLSDPTGVVVGNDTFNDNITRGFDEDQNIIIDADVTAYTSWNWNNSTFGGTDAITIAAGTEVASHYIAFDPLGVVIVNGWVEFDADILGILTDTGTLLATDSLINNDVTYLNPQLRGLENYQDWVRIDPNNANRVEFHFAAKTPGDYIRVLTKHSPIAAAPEPGIMMLLTLGLAGLGISRRFRRS